MVGTLLLSKMSLNVITVKLFCINKNQFLKNLCRGTHRGGFQFLLILDLWGIGFHAVIVFGLGQNLLFKSILGRCDQTKNGQNATVCMMMSYYCHKSVSSFDLLRCHTANMISTLLIISFGCLFNAVLVRPFQKPLVIPLMPQRCSTDLDCNSGEKCRLYVKLNY